MDNLLNRFGLGALGLTRKGRKIAYSYASSIAARYALLAPWYYAVGPAFFRREQHAVLAGVQQYGRDVDAAEGNSTLLRRNIHRLEKGLSMQPRRTMFAINYAAETVETYEKRLSVCHERGDFGPDIAWAHAVLTTYFEVTASHPVVDPLRVRFRNLPAPVVSSNQHLEPYQRDLSAPASVSFDDFLALSRRRRSVRWFNATPVARELIEKAMLVAAQAPTACNRQPFVFRVFDDRELVKRVAEIPMGAAGYTNQIPAIAVVVGQQRNFFDERDRHLIYIDGALAAMSFAFALETLGLSSCMINWPDIEGREAMIAECIGLEPDERPVMLIAFGYPDPQGLVPASVKKSQMQLLRYN